MLNHPAAEKAQLERLRDVYVAISNNINECCSLTGHQFHKELGGITDRLDNIVRMHVRGQGSLSVRLSEWEASLGPLNQSLAELETLVAELVELDAEHTRIYGGKPISLNN